LNNEHAEAPGANTNGARSSIVSAALRKPAVVGMAGLVVGLVIGVALGRGLVSSEGKTAVEPLQVRPPPQAVVQKPEVPAAPPYEYRRHLGRQRLKGKEAEGFAPLDVAGRQAVQITGKEATLRFGIDPKPGDYALTTIVHLEGAKGGTLRTHLDGQPLGTATLEDGWDIYYGAIPAALLGKRNHELSLSVEGIAKNGMVAVDSVAVVPLASEATVIPGRPGEGSWVDGFSKPQGGSIWSDGAQSVMGMVLAPASVDYRLTVKGKAMPNIAPLTVSAKINGTDVGSAVVVRKLAEATWSVPAKALRAGLNRIEFSYASTGRPSDFNPESKDNRALAVRFSTVSLRPSR
jgi:hypothetical protein